MKRRISYREQLIVAIREHLPWQFFAQWKVRDGLLWTPQRLVWMAILMAWSAEQTLTERFEAARGLLKQLFPRWRLGNDYTGWYQAMLRWSPWLQPGIAKRLRKQMQAFAGKHWLYEGWCAFAVDGSRVECPRTAGNEAALPCAGKKRTAPQLYVTTIWHMGLGLPWDYRVGPGTASERGHLEAMLTHLPPAALLVADAGFVGYELFQGIMAAGHSFLLRVGSNVHLLRKLGYEVQENRSTVYLWPTKQRGQRPLVLRLITLRRGKKKMYLVTNVAAQALSQESAQLLYERRWGVEVFYRTFKQTLQKRKMLSRAPQQAEAELHWAIVSLWLMGVMTVGEIMKRGGSPQSWSAALARKRLRQAMRALNEIASGSNSTLGLSLALKDNYVRHHKKTARDWPHKKREKPPGKPKIQVASPLLVQLAQRFRTRSVAA